MTDQELLELAANAAGISGTWVENSLIDCYYKLPTTGVLTTSEGHAHVWNSLTSSGDALRLEVALRFTAAWDPQSEKWVIGELLMSGKVNWLSSHEDRKRATTIAAAEYGKILSGQ